MTIPRLMPWIGGATKFEAAFSPLICPIDESIASQMIESDAAVVDAAVVHAHGAFLKHQNATTAKRVEWLNAPSYVNVDPASLGFQGGDTWGANPQAPTVEPILLRLVGEYQGFETTSSGPVTVAIDETLEIDPGQLPEFFFVPGSNYPNTLFFGGRPEGGPFQTLDLSLVVGAATREVRLTGQFVQVPEPGTIALALIASGGLGLCRVWRRTKLAA
jgi:hypothetical protein